MRILLQVLLWGIIFLFPLHLYNVRIEDRYFFQRELIDNLFIVLLFYLNVNFLIPRYFMKKEKRKYFLLIFMSLLVMICQQLVTERFFQKEHFSFHQRAYMEGHRSWREGDSGRPFRRDKEAFFSKSGMPPRPIILPNNLPSQDTFFEDDHPVMIAGMPSFVVFMVIRKTLTSSLLLLLVGSFLKLS